MECFRVIKSRASLVQKGFVPVCLQKGAGSVKPSCQFSKNNTDGNIDAQESGAAQSIELYCVVLHVDRSAFDST